MTAKAAENTARILAMLEPPEDLVLSDWAEKNIVIPEGQSVRPGATRMWSYLREPINAIGDRSVERVTIMKSARVGATKALMFAMAAAAATDPGPIILLMPTDDDARDAAVSEVEPLFRSSPALKGIMRLGRGDGRNTLMRKSLAGGGSIKILSARAPRNLRRHDCRLLLCDEIDAYEVTSEGDALALAERRTMAQAQRKIVCCSTPVDENTSVITPQLVAEYHEAKRGGPSLMKPFHNTVLARPWRTTIHKVDASILADRAEPWGLETPHHGVIIPDPVMRQTCEVSSSIGMLPRIISGKVGVHLVARSIGSPSALVSHPSASSMNNIREVWRLKLRGDFAATILSEPPGNWRDKIVLRPRRPRWPNSSAFKTPARAGDAAKSGSKSLVMKSRQSLSTGKRHKIGLGSFPQ
jgi:phage terminase large subunit GpA-like protein